MHARMVGLKGRCSLAECGTPHGPWQATIDQSTRWLRCATMASWARQDTANLRSLRLLQIYIHVEDEDAYASSGCI